MARTPRQIEDERLALRCRLGEPGAFAELVLEDMPVDEVATVVGCPPGTVKSRIYHAKRALKERSAPES